MRPGGTSLKQVHCSWNGHRSSWNLRAGNSALIGSTSLEIDNCLSQAHQAIPIETVELNHQSKRLRNGIINIHHNNLSQSFENKDLIDCTAHAS